MNRFFMFSVCLGAGMLQVACGSDKTTATSSGSAACAPISDSELAALFPTPAANPNSLLIYGSLGADANALFTNVTNSIVTKALAASTDTLGASFQTKLANATPERQAAFTADLKAFLESAFGGPAYDPSLPQMIEAHSDLDITVAQYNAFLTDVVVPALKDNKVDDATIAVMTPTVTNAAFVKTVVTCK